jgi:hypothetical protein
VARDAMIRSARHVMAAIGAVLIATLATACGATSSSRATMAAPHVTEENRNFSPGVGETEGSSLTDSIVMPESAPPEPGRASPESEPEAVPLPPPEPHLTPVEIASIKALFIQGIRRCLRSLLPLPVLRST